MFRVPDFQHDWTVNFYISHLPLKGKAMATKPRKRIPLRVALLATIIGLICTLSLFGETSQAASSMEAEACEGKGCVECDNSTQECPEPPAPTPEPSPSPTPTPTPTPDPTPTPAPSTPAPDPTPTPAPDPTPTPTPTISCNGKGCVECDNSTQECPEPPAPTPEPSPTPTPEPPAQSFLAKTGTLASTFAWIAIITFAIGWGAWNKSQQKRCV